MPVRHVTKLIAILCGALGLAAATIARADHLVMRDGTTRDGTVLTRDDKNLLLRMQDQGMRMTVTIPLADIASITVTPQSQPATSPTVPATQTSLATTVPAAAQAVEPRGHFFREWLLLGAGLKADQFDPESLPPDQAKLWLQSLKDDDAGDKASELAHLSILLKLGADLRLLNKLCMRHHGVLYGQWLGQIRWDQIRGKCHLGQFELSDVSAVETPTLIGLLRSATQDALAPLKQFYPLPPALADLPKYKRPEDPLNSIRMEDAAALKEKAFYAAAVLAAQISLEPDMPTRDRAFLLQQAGSIHGIIAKCSELEPLARAAAEKADRERKLLDAQKKLQGGP